MNGKKNCHLKQLQLEQSTNIPLSILTSEQQEATQPPVVTPTDSPETAAKEELANILVKTAT